MTDAEQDNQRALYSRRTFVQGLAVCAGVTAEGVSGTLAQGSAEARPPTTITIPPRDFSPRGAPTTYFWDPDILAVDASFNRIAQANKAIHRLHTGMLWAEGPGVERAGSLSGLE